MNPENIKLATVIVIALFEIIVLGYCVYVLRDMKRDGVFQVKKITER